MDAFKTDLTIPDLWQQKAVNLLRAEYDVIVDAPWVLVKLSSSSIS